jgi:transcription elongation GreA/GreB family factor
MPKLYDPGTPSALEAALAQQVASGQSPFAGALLTGYGLQRQQNVAAVNEAQAQSHLADLANLLATGEDEGHRQSRRVSTQQWERDWPSTGSSE